MIENVQKRAAKMLRATHGMESEERLRLLQFPTLPKWPDWNFQNIELVNLSEIWDDKRSNLKNEQRSLEVDLHQKIEEKREREFQEQAG